MTNRISVDLRGIDVVRSTLAALSDDQARALTRSVVYDIAKQVADDAKANMPKRTGNLIANTKPRQEKNKSGKAIATVMVARDAFYWRFLEFGTGPDGVEHAFFMRAVHKMSASGMAAILDAFARKLTSRIARRAKNGR